MKVEWTTRARRDLNEIGRFVARDDRLVARRWVARLRERARLAAETPLAGRMVPEVGREDIREVQVRNYRIVYRVQPDRIQVLTVFEGHRSFPAGVGDPP